MFTTVFLPEPEKAIRRDHSVADREERILSLKAQATFQREHKAKLENYVETRLALAEERARVEAARANQRAVAATTEGIASSGARSSKGTTMASGILSPWLPQGRKTDPRVQSRSTPTTVSDVARQIVDQIPARTKEILRGNDELVTGNMAHGLPKGLAVFLALLMLHVPSVAIASLVTGTILIRRHSTHAGAFFLGLAAILGVVIFALLPW